MQLQLYCNKLCAHLVTVLLYSGTDWADKAKLDAQVALKTRYGIEDDAQGWQGLKIATNHMKFMYALPDHVSDRHDSSDCSSDDALDGSCYSSD